MIYKPGVVGDVSDPFLLLQYLIEQFEQIASALDSLQIKVYTTVPKNPTAPVLAIAAGSWDPGEGPGLYYWDLTSWNKVG